MFLEVVPEVIVVDTPHVDSDYDDPGITLFAHGATGTSCIDRGTNASADSTDHGESVLDVDPSRLEDLLDGDANEVVVDVLGPIVTDPILDVPRHNQPYITDTSSKIPAIDSGETTALLLARPDSSVADVDGRTTKDTIHHCDAPTKKAVYLNERMLVLDQSRLADRLYRQRHSHGETTAHPLYPNGTMPAVDPSRLADRQYRHHHSHGESATAASLTPSKHMKFVSKLIEWENGEGTTNSLSPNAANDLAATIDEVIAKDLAIDGIIPRSYIEKKTRHILQPLLSIKNNWLSSMSVSLL
jgi:hypothetical protein